MTTEAKEKRILDDDDERKILDDLFAELQGVVKKFIILNYDNIPVDHVKIMIRCSNAMLAKIYAPGEDLGDN